MWISTVPISYIALLQHFSSVLIYFSCTKTMFPNPPNHIIRGEGTVTMQAKLQTLLSSQWSMLVWPRTTLTIWASKPSWRLQRRRRPRPWPKARENNQQKRRGRRLRNESIKQRRIGGRSRRKRRKRRWHKFQWGVLMLCLKVSVRLMDQLLICTFIQRNRPLIFWSGYLVVLKVLLIGFSH